MPKCKDCKTRNKSIKEIKEKCPDPNTRFCTYYCDDCGEEFSIIYSPIIVIPTENYHKNVCPGCSQK